MTQSNAYVKVMPSW